MLRAKLSIVVMIMDGNRPFFESAASVKSRGGSLYAQLPQLGCIAPDYCLITEFLGGNPRSYLTRRVGCGQNRRYFREFTLRFS